MSEMNSVVAVYSSHDEAGNAVEELRKAGVDVTKISIVGKDYHSEEQVTGYYNAGDRMKYWGKMGALWGGIWGVLVGAAFFVIPGIGPVLVAGPLVAWIVAGLEGAVVVGGLSAVGAGLYSIGIPKNTILRYEVALAAGKFLVVLHGSPEQVAKARDVIKTTNPATLDVHEPELVGA
jgi:hypothetical protein